MHNGTKLLESDLNNNTKTIKVKGGSKFLSIIIFQIFLALGLKQFKHCVVRSFKRSPRFLQTVPTMFAFSSVFSAFLSRAWTLLGEEVCIPARKCKIIKTTDAQD